jgi:hypothetical protein
MASWARGFVARAGRREILAAAITAVCWATVFSSLAAYAARVQAQAGSSERRLVVLHRGGEAVPAELRAEVDQLVLRAVTERVHFAAAYGSQVPFEDVELAADCTARDTDCMQRIATSLDADWLLVRELVRDREGQVYLTLVAHDGPQAIVTRRAVARLAAAPNDPAHVVPMLVERLYPGASDTVASASPARDALPSVDASSGRSPLRMIGWSTLAAGSGLLAAGITIGALSQRDHRAYGDAQINTPADVDRASEELDRAQKRARIANGLLIGGAAAGAAGAVALLWSYLRPRPDERSLRVRVAPSRAGVALSLGGAWRGGL